MRWLLCDQIDRGPRRRAPSLDGSLSEDLLGANRLGSLRALFANRRIGEALHTAFGQEAQLSEINWAVELRKIEREYDGLPPEPTANELRQKREAERRVREREESAAASFGVYFRLTLVICLGVSLVCWPYQVTCGAMLTGYLAAVIVLVVGGVWTAMATFRHQMSRRHLVALTMIVWGVVLGAAEILPRVGYANPIPGRATSWRCAE